ncbi:MAG: hypothetical protein AABY95_09975 [Pseudomonadota bacterium]
MRFWCALLALTLAACDNAETTVTTTTPGGDGTQPPVTLCVDSGCGEKTVLLTIPDAENIFFTADNRLFVSGGTNVFEIKKEGVGYTATPIFAGTGNFGGMAQRGDVLYVNCFTDRSLYAARLTATPTLAPIHDLGIGIPNGMSAGPDGEIYIVNGPIPSNGLPDPKIVRLRFDPANPMVVTEQSDWLALPQSFPNGVARIGRTLYVTNGKPLPPTFGEVLRIEISADGSAGTPTQLASFMGLTDDLSVAGDTLLVSLYSNGVIAQVGLDGTVIAQTDPMSFEFPSQVRVGQPPLFAADEILVTEKGMVGDSLTPVGDAFSVFRRTSN